MWHVHSIYSGQPGHDTDMREKKNVSQPDRTPQIDSYIQAVTESSNLTHMRGGYEGV